MWPSIGRRVEVVKPDSDVSNIDGIDIPQPGAEVAGAIIGETANRKRGAL